MFRVFLCVVVMLCCYGLGYLLCCASDSYSCCNKNRGCTYLCNVKSCGKRTCRLRYSSKVLQDKEFLLNSNKHASCHKREEKLFDMVDPCGWWTCRHWRSPERWNDLSRASTFPHLSTCTHTQVYIYTVKTIYLVDGALLSSFSPDFINCVPCISIYEDSQPWRLEQHKLQRLISWGALRHACKGAGRTIPIYR